MESEFEAKFYPVDKEEYRKKLKSIGAVLSVPERKMRRVIADHHDNTGLNCDYIRVRDEGNLVRLSAKIHAKPGGGVGDQKEADMEVPDFDKTKEILEYAGLKFVKYQESLREEWEFEGATITIDTWPCLDTYSEIEASSEEQVKDIAIKLGLDWDGKLLNTLDELCSKVYGISQEKALDMIKNVTFENNPFSGMKKIWPSKE
jgi:adenylate cyclase class IV